MNLRLVLFSTLSALLFLTGCSTHGYTYHYVPGKTATLQDGVAISPEDAPDAVQAAIAAGNRIAGLPYRYGGGHGSGEDSGYDCSGSVSYVLRGAGLLDGCMPSGSFRRYGRSGDGDWITIWARSGHVFMSVAGLRFDTGWHGQNEGPRWTKKSRPGAHYELRHPSGL